MEEIVDDVAEAREEETDSELDLTGIDPEIHDYVRALGATERVASAARRAALNKDGSVIVKLIRSVALRSRNGEDHHDRIRLRPLAAKQYIEGGRDGRPPPAIDAESEEFDAQIRLGKALANVAHQAVIDQVDNMDDLRAIYFGVLLARKNFSRPMS